MSSLWNWTLTHWCKFQDANFSTSLELAVRFGKTLIIQEVDGVEPVLYPLLRGDLSAQGECCNQKGRDFSMICAKVRRYNEIVYKIAFSLYSSFLSIWYFEMSRSTQVNFADWRK